MKSVKAVLPLRERGAGSPSRFRSTKTRNNSVYRPSGPVFFGTHASPLPLSAVFLSACVHHSQQAHRTVKYKTLRWGAGGRMCVLGNFLHLSEVQGAGGRRCCLLLCAGKDVRVSEGSGERRTGAGCAPAHMEVGLRQPRLLVPYLENTAARNLSTSTYRRPIMQSAAAYRRFA